MCTKFLAHGVPPPAVPTPPLPMTPVPGGIWLLLMCAREVTMWLEDTKAQITSFFSSFLKMTPIACPSIPVILPSSVLASEPMVLSLSSGDQESCRHGSLGDSIGNKHGLILISILTANKGAGLHPMAVRILQWYREASVSPPQAQYVEYDSCSLVGKSKVASMFHEWNWQVVQLDVLHLMQCFAAGVTTESHPMYFLFMGHLSFTIFEWDEGNAAQLYQALATESVKGPRGSHISDISLKDLSRHCSHCTCGQ
ncbi:uncharacterized protein LOC120527555 [Polypterus senegalus]|uniref:uncharacterized protein LOC120527555 n=1 Tax=Polypterus senegalus TaxID=55291 RepID=UPI0019655678|nr:uncharacterized protein LOC120527555 [Polypterus senegalus]